MNYCMDQNPHRDVVVYQEHELCAFHCLKHLHFPHNFEIKNSQSSVKNNPFSTMALRDYMQDLLRSQTSGDDEYAKAETMHIIIVDDNTCSSIPDEYDESMDGSQSTLDLPSANSSTRTLNNSTGGERDESNRNMLDGFRRRKRFLRETLSPKPSKPSSGSITESPFWSSPSPVTSQFTHDDSDNLDVTQEPCRTDSLRGRMYRLKTNRLIQRNSSPPLLWLIGPRKTEVPPSTMYIQTDI